MSEHELEKLLGGFAADTLTPEERQKLFEAALEEQQLFNTLANEQALKELLTDPVVRRRLLDAFPQTSLSPLSGSFSWWEWFRRPVGLTFAGGLAAAIVAVVIGTKVYQDSLKQAAQSVATEEARPTASPAPAPPASQPSRPSVVEPQPKARESAGPTKEKDALRDKIVKQKRPSTAPSQSQEQRASEGAGDRVQRNEPDAVRKQADAPVAQTSAPLAGVAASSSARALFYERGATRADEPAMAGEKGRARLEQKAERFAAPGNAAGSTARLKPLGLRYSFVVRGNDGEDREVDATAALKYSAQARLTVEANQDAYLQILKTVGAASAQLFYPRGGARTSLPIVAGKRYEVPLPASAESEPATLIVRLSREPLQEVERQEAGSTTRLSPDLLIESVAPGGASGSQELATYVITLDPAPTAQIAVERLLSR